MISVSMAIEDRTLRNEVNACLEGELVQLDSVVPQVSSLEAFLAAVERSCPDVVLIDVSSAGNTPQETVAKVRLATPGSMVVALSTTASTDSVLECFRAGADEYLFSPVAVGLKRMLARRQSESREADSLKASGRVITFLSAKGGCGATTLACHVAAELGRLSPGVLLADFDVNNGIVSFLTKSKSAYSIMDALDNVHRLDASYWGALVSNSLPGLDIISAPPATVARKDASLQSVRQVIAFARKQYPWTLADAGSGIDESAITAIDLSDETFLVTTPEIPALHQTKQILQKLLDSGYKQEQLRLIVNRVPKRSGVNPNDLPEMLGVPVYAVIPDAYLELHEALAEGKLLKSDSGLGSAISSLTRKLIGVTKFKPLRKVSLLLRGRTK
jgi:pilus assembly protein CpaE